MIRVMPDTNALVGGGARPMQSNDIRRLLGLSKSGKLKLVLAEIVVREAANKWAEAVVRAEADYTKSRAFLEEAELLDGAPKVRLEKSEIRRSEEARIREIVTAVGGEIAPLPSTSHAEVVTRALERRQPFDSNGRNGYRDVILWETLLELGSVGRTIVLISQDKRAFFEDSNLAKGLAGELRTEAEKSFGDGDAVHLHAELRGAVESALELAEDDEDESLRIEAEENERASRNLAGLLEDREFVERLEEAIGLAMTHYDLGADLREYGVPDSEAASASIDAVETINHHQFASVYRTEDGNVLADLIVDMTLVANVTVPTGDAFLLDEQPQVTITDPGWGGGVAEGQAELAARVTLECEIDPEHGTLAILPLVSGIEPMTPKQFLAAEG